MTRVGVLCALVGVVDTIIEVEPWNWPGTLDMNAFPWGMIAFSIGVGFIVVSLMVTEVPQMWRDYPDDG